MPIAERMTPARARPECCFVFTRLTIPTIRPIRQMMRGTTKHQQKTMPKIPRTKDRTASPSFLFFAGPAPAERAADSAGLDIDSPYVPPICTKSCAIYMSRKATPIPSAI